MRVVRSLGEMRQARAALQGIVGFVPTMGYLHEGHLSLVRRARAECHHVVVSIFVNPTQFGPSEDYQRYPRDEARDLAMLEAEGVDVAFLPSAGEMYPPGFCTWVEVQGPLTERLEGASRPGHFRGVATVVLKLFNLVQPHRAYFGEKDAQQLRVIRRMVADLNLPVEIVPCPTVREPDGLAMSSRNVYLSPEERQQALALSRALELARRLVREEGLRDAAELRQRLESFLRCSPGVELDYVSVAHPETLAELERIEGPALVLLAARVGPARLIDNALIEP
ncbi:MAG: pantoate--beta-alanine ligase [Dehalococcoidia bacterium]|nr:pantoate--beta-alanine ligase [Dehalococcoidia bacterium]MDW8008829.1 pantoate--beta-alanine ligase [Chloroflexota bacterium]